MAETLRDLNLQVKHWRVGFERLEEELEAAKSALIVVNQELDTFKRLAGDSQALLRNVVDIAWNEATESTTVPSTDWADRIIERARKLTGEEAATKQEQPR